MSLNIKAVFEKYLDQGSNVKEKEKLTLDNWYELEEAAYEAKKLSGDSREKWDKITGRGRMFDCLMGEVEGFIKQLGGKVLAERERERQKPLWEMPKEFSWGSTNWGNWGSRKSQSDL